MHTLKLNWLSAGLSIIVLFLGLSVTVHATENGDKGKEKTERKTATVVATQWFEYMDLPGSSPFNPASYRALEEDEPLPNCPEGTKVCAINAPIDGNGDPVIDTTLQQEITNATNAKAHSTNVKVRN